MALESRRRYQLLIENLKGYQRVGVAFSGGVDSTLLLYAACEALGRQNVLVLRGLSALLSATEKGAGSMLLDHLQIEPERLLEVELQPLDWPEFVINDGARCYVCKKRMYQHFLTVLEGKNISVLLDGSNVDDLKSHRPGSRAIEELGVKTPLLDAGLTKKDIRALASVFQLANHAKPSNSCLATRFPEGSPVTREGLELVAQCESFLLSRGFSGCRVRPGSKKDVVLQVTAEDMGRLLETFERQEIIDYFSNVGFEKVLIDLRVRSL